MHKKITSESNHIFVTLRSREMCNTSSVTRNIDFSSLIVKLHSAVAASKHFKSLSCSSIVSPVTVKVSVDFLQTVPFNKFVYGASEGRNAVGNTKR